MKSLKQVRFFTVGPSQIYSTVPSHVENALRKNVLSISHRGSEFKDIYKRMDLGLRKLLKIPADYEIVVLSSALEAMDRVIQSMSHNNSYHILTGNFGKIWMNISSDLGKSPESFQFFNWDNSSDKAIKQSSNKVKKGIIGEFENIKIPKKFELVCITQNDTSVGFTIPMEEIYKLRNKNPDKLFALDIVSSVPYVNIEYKYLDAVFFSVQKGFGLPAGLAVLILSPDALKKAEKLSKLPGYSIGSYHNLLKLVDKSHQLQTNETPNVLGIYLLACVVEDFLKIGLSKIRKRLDVQAHMLYSFFSKPEYYTAFIKEEKYRSVTDPVFEIFKGSTPLIKFAAEKRLILGAGYRASSAGGMDFKEEHIRVANFPAITEADIKKLFKVVRQFYN